MKHCIDYGITRIYALEKGGQYYFSEIEGEILPDKVIQRLRDRPFKNCAEIKKIIETGEIDYLKEKLAETDYKIIKSYEYQLAGLELPYDVQELHTERQAIRDRINLLEG